MAYRTRDFTGEIMAGLSGIGQIGEALNDKKKADLLAKEGAQRIKESEQQQKMNQQKIDTSDTVRKLSEETEARGALAPAAMEGKGPGNTVDMAAIKSAKQADSDAKLYNLVNQGKEGFLPMSGGAFRKMAGSKALEANKADQKEIVTEERDAKEFGLKSKKLEAETGKLKSDAAAGKYQPVVLGDGRLGAFSGETGAVKDTGEKAPPKPAAKTSSPEEGLPLDTKKQIEVLSSKSAGKLAIANQLESDLIQLRDAMGLDAEGNPIPGKKPNEDLAYSYSQNMLKTMNSKEGADAVGVDEAKRAAGLLEYNVADIPAALGMKPGKFHGRDIDGFMKQVGSNIAGIKGSVEFNKKEIDRLYGRQPAAAPTGGSKFKILAVED